ncbi:MAG: hypothetical protein ACI4ON_04090 [Clostridia bacterium]
MVIIIIFVSIIYFLIINNSYRQGEINYKNLNSKLIIENSNVIYDRAILMTIDDICNDLLKVNFNSLVLDGKQVKLKDIYKYDVTSNYKKEISSRKFIKKMSEIYNNVFNENEDISSLEYKQIIEAVYYSAQYDMYLVKIKTNNQDVQNYIGIRLYNSNTKFSIIYVE